MTDEHIPNAVVTELTKRGVHVQRLIDILEEGTPDPEVLEYANEHGYTLITADEHITGHIKSHVDKHQEYKGVFIVSQNLGAQLIGRVVEEISFFDGAIKANAANLEDDVYNQIRYIK